MSKIHLIGNAHVDPAWMWRTGEGLEAFIATCRSALDRIDETPEFIFTCSSAAHYAFLLEVDPELFKRIQGAVAAGRWSIVGGWWVEADCNLPSGESFVRQALYGQRFFLEHFGRIAQVGYCIDSFGHNANLPQLLSKAGMPYFVFMRPEESEMHLESSLFNWESQSGDRVLAYRIPLHYSNHEQSTKQKIHELKSFSDFDRHPWMIFYGVGNHGGGPTRIELESILKQRNTDSTILFSDPEKYFRELASEITFDCIVGEFQPHSIGCYSAASEIKRLNRLSEHQLLVAERIGILANRLSGFSPKLDELRLAWKNVCFNQFHDILGGVAIPAALEDAVNTYRESLSIAQREIDRATQTIACDIDTSGHIESLIVLNSSAVAREEFVEFDLWHPVASEQGDQLNDVSLETVDGRHLSTQRIESSARIGDDRVRFGARVSVPALGYGTFGIHRGEKTASSTGATSSAEEHLASALLVRTPAEVYNDPTDTWGHGVTGFTDRVGAFEEVSREVIENGPLRHGIRIESSYGASRLVEDWLSFQGSDMIEVRIRLDWREKRKLLRSRFQHNCKVPKVTSEIPYGTIEREVGPREWPGQRWVFVSDSGARERGGLGIISDSKYSYSTDARHVSVIVARSPIAAHHSPPHAMFPDGLQRYLDQGEQEFRFWIVSGHKNWRVANMPSLADRFLEPLIVHAESGHRGSLPRVSLGGFSISSPNVQLIVLKQAEQGTGAIVRLVETLGQSVDAAIELPILDAKWLANFKPYEIKSFRIDRNGEVNEVNLLEL